METSRCGGVAAKPPAGRRPTTLARLLPGRLRYPRVCQSDTAPATQVAEHLGAEVLNLLRQLSGLPAQPTPETA
jgi:hypothetical protein